MALIQNYAVKFIVMAALSFNTFCSLAAIDLTGAGGTFPAPIYSRWAADYQQLTGNRINYQGIGSSGGIKQIIAKTVDFGATDTPLSEEELQKNGLFQFPTVVGGIVIVVNLPGIASGQLTLDGQTLGDIYLGRIKKWNDVAIARLNPGLSLPASSIAVVRRADGAGTSFVFTRYLSKVNKVWNDTVGVGNTVNWPTGLGGKGNDGIAAFVQRLPGAIGYVEYSYAKQSKLAYTNLFTADGKRIAPTEDAFKNASKSVDWNASFAQDLTYQKGADVWPITSTTFILVHKLQSDAEKGKEMLKFFDWAYKNGHKAAGSLDYAMLPDAVLEKIRGAWKTSIKDNSGKSLN